MFWKIIATGFGSGYSPVAPGTAGALLGCLMLWGLQATLPDYFSGGWSQVHNLLILTGLFFFLGIIAGRSLEKEWGKDPQQIVVDEMVGVWVAMMGVPFSLPRLLLAFVLFRLFDIWKPLGIRRMEQFGGGWGVMMDDVLAGIYANICVQILIFYGFRF